MSKLSDHTEPLPAASCELFKGLCVIGLGDAAGGLRLGQRSQFLKGKRTNEHNCLGPFGWGEVSRPVETPSYFSAGRASGGQSLLIPQTLSV